jgi:hypothetical protein
LHGKAATDLSLADVLSSPDVLRSLRPQDWDRVVPQARRAGLEGRLYDAVERNGLLATTAAEPLRRLEAALVLSEKHASDVRREVRFILKALSGTGIPVILLKGAAYVAAGLPPARGRLFGDVDILVPREALPQVEMSLRAGGWIMAKRSPYDLRYYRTWMHQLPPMTHAKRQTVIDVHHTIVPLTARAGVNAETLLAHSLPVPGMPGLAVLAPSDMVLHSATHLFNEGEFDRGLRDLSDLDLLMRHFGAVPSFWPALIERAAELDLRRPLFYCLRYASRLLGTPVPNRAAEAADAFGPPKALRRFMDALFDRALRPPHPDCRDALSGIALWLLYVRAHHLRMPAHLLVPHLIRKALMRRLQAGESA